MALTENRDLDLAACPDAACRRSKSIVARDDFATSRPS
jgi:hypothetical protein